MKYTKTKFYLVCFMYIFFLWSFIQNVIPIFSYWDEFIVILFLALLIKNKASFFREQKKMCICYGLFLLIAIISTVISRMQSVQGIMEDIIVNLKFIANIGFFYYIYTPDIIYKFHKVIYFHIRVQVLVIIILIIFNRIFEMFDTSGNWHGIFMGDKLFFAHPTYMAAFAIYLMCLLFMMSKWHNIKVVYIALVFIAIDTLKAKAIAWIFASIFVYLFIFVIKRRISWFGISVLGIVSIFAAKNKILYYFVTLDKSSARSVLMYTSMKIAKDFFPLGSGFGSFGSGASAKYYSDIYMIYNINNVWGLGGNNKKFISDTFWPMILGQFGIMGLIMYICFLVVLFEIIQKCYKIDKKVYYSLFVSFMYLAIASMGEPSYVNGLSVAFAFVLGVGIRYIKFYNNNKFAVWNNTQ